MLRRHIEVELGARPKALRHKRRVARPAQQVGAFGPKVVCRGGEPLPASGIVADVQHGEAAAVPQKAGGLR